MVIMWLQGLLMKMKDQVKPYIIQYDAIEYLKF